MTTQTTEDIEREAELEIQGWIDWNRAQRKKRRRAAHAMHRDRQRKEPSDRAQWRQMPATAEQLDALRQLASETGVTFLNTTVATCAAMLGWLLVERLVHGKATSLGAASGIVAGLVAITPSCGAVEPVGAILIGLIAGGVCALAVGLKFKFGYDDSLDVVGVHLVGGVIGSLLIGLFSSSDAPGGIDGLFYGGGLGSLGDQFMGVLVTVVWTGILTTAIAFAIKRTIGWRITEEAEVEGIDSNQHGESAYDIAAGTGVLA